MSDPLRHFEEVWLVDFEFHCPPGDRPEPICLVAREYRTGRTHRVWVDELARMASPPFPIGANTLLVAYYASAELGCFLALGWPMPARVLDPFTEFRCRTNGLEKPCGNGLLGALAYFGLNAIDAAEKTEMRDLAIRGGPYSAAERAALLDYCESDVVGLNQLLPVMLPQIDLSRALLRGRYMAAVAAMEWAGVPIDVETLAALRAAWTDIRVDLIARVDADYGVYDGTTFKVDRFTEWLIRSGTPWPRLESGQLALDDDTFRQMARSYPAVATLRELRQTLGQLRLEKLAVGRDGRNRCLLSAFQSKTGRNQPSTSAFIFGSSCWLRGLIKPGRDRAVAYIDWSAQENGIAAALSGDPVMMADYRGGDPYLGFGKRVGIVPADATKQSHPEMRDRLKVAMGLGALYGAGPQTVADTTGVAVVEAREWLRLHRQTYPTFWWWSESAVNHAMLLGWLQTVFGWKVHVGSKVNPRSFANFPMQANGAEMLRLACCLATERGILVCAPVHDALLVEGPAVSIDEVVAETKRAMAEASRIVLRGFELRTDAKIISYPDRYMDKRGERMWQTIMGLLADLGTQRGCDPQPSVDAGLPSHRCDPVPSYFL